MAGLSSGLRLGTGSTSALLRSANSIQSQINTYNDAVAAQRYALSAKSDSDLATYQKYLTSRIKTLSAANNVSDATKAVSMTNTLTSAIKSNGSANIQRENIQVMAGNATLQDKYNVIVSQYARAVAIGDMSLAQSLESQAYSVSQTIQYQAQVARDAANTLAKATNSANASSQERVASTLENSLKQLNNDIQNAGMRDFNSTVKAWVKTNQKTLGILGVKVGNQPNYFDVVSGVAGAIYNAHMLAYQADLPTNPEAAQSYFEKAMNVASGITSLPTLGGALSIQEVQAAAANPTEYAYNQATGKLEQTQQTGYQYQNGKLAPTFSGSLAKQTIGNSQANGNVTVLAPETVNLFNKLGLDFSSNSASTNDKGQVNKFDNGIEVQATANTPAWLRAILGDNGITNVYLSSHGGLQIAADSTTGAGRAFYTIATDQNGIAGLIEHLPDGKLLNAGGDYGFNGSWVSQMIQTGQAAAQLLQNQVQAATEKLAVSLPKAPSPIKVAPLAPQPTISIKQPPATQSVVPKTVNPQAQAKSPQPVATPKLQGGGITLQGSGGNLNQSGAGGIQL